MAYHYNVCYLFEHQNSQQNPELGYFSGALSDEMLLRYFTENDNQLSPRIEAFVDAQLGFVNPHPAINRQLF